MYGLEFLGVMPTPLLILAAVIAMILDIVSGFLRAAKNNEISSEKMRIGLWHKTGFCGIIILGIYLQWVQALTEISSYIGVDIPTTGALCVYIIACEVVSIRENLANINPEIDGSPIGKLGSDHDSL